MSTRDPRISRILEAIQKIASGNFKNRLDISSSPDDIDCISTGINMLSERINSRIEEQKKENKELKKIISSLNKKKEELSRSEQMFSRVFQTTPDTISISSLKDGKFVEINRSFELLTGYKRNEIIGHSVFEIGLWNDKSTRSELEKRLIKDGYCNNLEAKFKIRDGSVRQGLLSASLLHLNDEPHLLVVGRDITGIKKAEEVLQHTQKKYKDLIQNSPTGILLLNASGIIEVANPASAKLIGLPVEEIEGLNYRDIRSISLKDLPKLISLFGQIMQGRTPKPMEMKFTRPDGTDLFIEAHITPIHKGKRISGIQAVFQDITERVRAVEALRISEAHYRTSMDAMQDSMYVVNPDLIITVVNKSLKEVLKGLDLRTEITGKHLLEAFPFLDAETLEDYKEVFNKGRTKRKEAFYRIGKVERLMDTRIIPILEGKRVTKVLTIVQDVTERKKEEKVRQIMYNISNAVNLTGNLDELFRSIQHELGKILDTQNFFIAFYNREDDTLSLPFFVDEKDNFSSFPAKKSLTGYMIRIDRPLLMKNADIEKLVRKGILDDVGTPSKIWLGVPLKIRDEIIGALVMQNYENEEAYNEKDLEMLKFVSSQIGLSIETKRAYQEVQVEKAYFEQLFEGSPETIVLTSNEGKLLKVNSEFQKLFGYKPEEVIGKEINKLIVPGEYLAEADMISKRAARGEKVLIETLRRHKDGHLIHVSVMGTPIEIEGGQVAVYGIYRDITDRKNAEIALRESEEKLRNILSSSPDAITVSDLRGYITECNHAALELFECTHEKELIQENANRFVIPEQKKKGISSLKNVLRHGYVKNVEFELITHKGKKIYVDLSASLIRDNNDRPIGIVAITQDITARKAYEKDLKLAKEKAEESDRLKSAFLANMSHEIRTPMNAILGFAELLRSEDLPKDTRDEYIKIINNKGKELLFIISDIIDISKIEAGDVKILYNELDVNEILKKIRNQLNEEKSLMNKDHLQLRLNLPEGNRPVIISDEARLRQIMNNLINNALKFTLEGYVEIGYNLTDGKVRFFVKDTGIGIAKENQEMVFDRFRQVDESINTKFGGTGLGLSISRNLVNLLGGEIWMDSEINQGSTFYFTHPLHDNRPYRGEKKSRDRQKKESQLDLKGKKILIAEDDSANYLFIESYLKRTRSEILWARDGKQLLEIFQAEPDLDLILMDLRMPNLNGIDATRLIRETNESIPVIALTAYAFEDDIQKSVEAGCNDYLSKPVKIEQLSETLIKYLK